jgi:hypothetical protein
VVTTESAWDDAQRSEAEAAWDAEHLLTCPQCGNPREVCSQPDVDVWPQRSVCYVTAVREAAQRSWRAHVDGKTVPPVEVRRDDGVTIWASLVDLDPDGPGFEGEVGLAVPSGLVGAEQATHQQPHAGQPEHDRR